MNTPIVCVIGAGNMGTSLVGGLVRDGHPPDQIFVADLSDERLVSLNLTYPVHIMKKNEQIPQNADVLILAVKPDQLANSVKSLAASIHQRKLLIISIAAGIRIKSIQSWLIQPHAIVRAMPNTPALIGCGATGLYANSLVSDKQKETAESILRALGLVVWVTNEALLDIVTALSGSGPAYFFLMMEALEQAAIHLGLSQKDAHLLTLQTALGAAKMAIEGNQPLKELRLKVTSPGGTTEKAISVLEENNISRIFEKALLAAKLRSEELAEIIGK